MKTTTTAAAVIALAGLSLTAAPAAQASETKQIAICHFDNGQGGKYTQNTIDKNAVTKTGHGSHDRDIIPPFTWNNGGNDHGSYPGLNWTPENQTLWAAGCNPANIPLAPVLPTPPQGTCINPAGEFTLPAQVEGVTIDATYTDGAYTITYTKPADTAHTLYTWADGFKGTATIKPLPPLTTDPLWDTAAGECRMPDTGADGISSTALMLGGGALGAGLIAVAFAPLIRRRTR
jgi:hypothetical protein